MATKILGRYDHPNNTIRREAYVVGAAGTGTKNRFASYQKMRVKAAHLVVRTAGTATAFTAALVRSEAHTSELQSLLRISYAVFCLKKKITPTYSIQRHT